MRGQLEKQGAGNGTGTETGTETGTGNRNGNLRKLHGDSNSSSSQIEPGMTIGIHGSLILLTSRTRKNWEGEYNIQLHP